MIKKAILDTSVAVVWYLPESFTDKAKKWHEKLLEGEVQLYVPTLHYYEFANVLRKYCVFRNMDADTAKEIWNIHNQCPLEVCDPQITQLMSRSLDYQATAYDSVFISLAIELKIPILTAEKSNHYWVQKLGRLVHGI